MLPLMFRRTARHISLRPDHHGDRVEFPQSFPHGCRVFYQLKCRRYSLPTSRVMYLHYGHRAIRVVFPQQSLRVDRVDVLLTILPLFPQHLRVHFLRMHHPMLPSLFRRTARHISPRPDHQGDRVEFPQSFFHGCRVFYQFKCRRYSLQTSRVMYFRYGHRVIRVVFHQQSLRFDRVDFLLTILLLLLQHLRVHFLCEHHPMLPPLFRRTARHISLRPGLRIVLVDTLPLLILLRCPHRFPRRQSSLRSQVLKHRQILLTLVF